MNLETMSLTYKCSECLHALRCLVVDNSAGGHEAAANEAFQRSSGVTLMPLAWHGDDIKSPCLARRWTSLVNWQLPVRSRS